jgi:hypothetical protein
VPFTFVLYRVAALDPPRITSPAHRAFVNTDTLAVEGVVPLGTPYVEVNGVPGTIDPGGVRFTATIPVPRDLGFHVVGLDIEPRPLVVTAVAYPQGTGASVEVTPDFTPPEFRLVLPEDGAATLDEAVAYGGWVSEAATLTLAHAGGEQVRATIRDRAREAEEFFNLFSRLQFHRFDFAPVAVATGTNTVTLTARDRAGNASEVVLDVTRFGAALALTSPTAPVPALSTDLVFDVIASVTLQGLFVNGRFLPSTRALALPAGTATIANVPLEPGVNALRLVYEQAGAPVQVLNAEVTSSAAGASLLTGTVTDAETGAGIAGALVQVVINGQTLLVATDANGVYRVLVGEGEATVTLFAEGYAGGGFAATVGGGTTEVNAALAPTGIPALANQVAILVPPEGAVTDWEQVTVVGTVLNPASSVMVNGIAAEVVGNRFTAKHVPLAMGANAISVTASALGSAPATATRSLTRSETPVLDVQIYSPPEGASVPGSGLVVRGWVSARRARTLVSGGALALVEEGVFVVPELAVPAGSTSVGAIAQSADGQESASDGVGVSVDSVDPAMVLTADSASGIAPLDVGLTVSQRSPFAIRRIDFDLDGDLEPDVLADDDGLIETTFADAAPRVVRALVTSTEAVELSAPARIHSYLAPEIARTFASGNPVDLARDVRSTDIWVLDSAAATVARYSQDGDLLSSFGSGGAGPTQLSNPQAFDIDADGTVYVADTGNARIQVFSADGTHLQTIGAGQLAGASGIAVDAGVVAVSDPAEGAVRVFSADGEARGAAPVASPRGMATTPGLGFVVASPADGLRTISVYGSTIAIGTPSALERPANRQHFPAPVDVTEAGVGLLVADASTRSVVTLGRGLGFEREVTEGLGVRPLAVLAGARRAMPSVYIADGNEVLEIALPVPSPVPAVQDLKARLQAGDIPGALARIYPFQRGLFEQIYSDLGANLAVDANAMGPMSVDLLEEGRAIVRVDATDYTGPNAVVRKFPVQLIRAEDGTWQIFDY